METSGLIFKTFADAEAQADFEGQMAELARNVIDISATIHNVELDLSFHSLRAAEQMLANYHRVFAMRTEADKARLVARWGAYVGEVMRAMVGGTWGRVTQKGETFAGLRLDNGQFCWPHDKVRKRLVLGPEHDIVSYCEILCEITRPN